MSVVEFLEARLAEDEAVAHAALSHLGVFVEWHQVEELRRRLMTRADAYHIARHDPARVLREVAAKRAVIAQCKEASADRGQVISEFCCTSEEVAHAWATDPGDLIVRSLASVYSDHPGYDPAWKVGN